MKDEVLSRIYFFFLHFYHHCYIQPITLLIAVVTVGVEECDLDYGIPLAFVMRETRFPFGLVLTRKYW